MSYGIYIHIPFCLKRCYYCDFFSSIYDSSLLHSYLDAIKREISSRNIDDEEVSSIYIGGGTPSLLKDIEISDVICTINKFHKISSNCEITLEANPHSLNITRLKGFRDAGINRISLGIQSIYDDDLNLIGRLHNGHTAIQSIRNAHSCGFDNISVDLLYGLPTQDNGKWLNTLKTVINEHPHHISTYELSVYENTHLHKMVSEGKIKMPKDETIVEMYISGAELLEHHGYRQYEISNFCMIGYESKHNLNYWTRGKYIGIGAGAHSFDGNVRCSNVEDITEYISSINSGKPATVNYFALSSEDIKKERIFLCLRTSAGIDICYLNCSDEVLRQLILQDLIRLDERCVKLTRKGMILSNEVILQVW